MIEDRNTEPQEDNPIGEMELPGRPRFGARVAALAGSTIGLGVAVAIGALNETTSATPTPWTR